MNATSISPIFGMANEQARTAFIAQTLLPNADEIKGLCITGGRAEMKENFERKVTHCDIAYMSYYMHKCVLCKDIFQTHEIITNDLIFPSPGWNGSDTIATPVSRTDQAGAITGTFWLIQVTQLDFRLTKWVMDATTRFHFNHVRIHQ